MTTAQLSLLQVKSDLQDIDAFHKAKGLVKYVETYKEWDQEDLVTYLWQPITLKQYFLFQKYGTDEYRGFLSWAWLDIEQEVRFIYGRSRFGDFSKNTIGSVPWIIDFVMPYSRRETFWAYRYMRKWFSNNVDFKNFTCLRAIRGNGKFTKYYREGGYGHT